MIGRRGFLASLVAPYVARFIPARVPTAMELLVASGPGPMMIDRATFKFWRNQTAIAAYHYPMNAAAMREVMHKVYRECR